MPQITRELVGREEELGLLELFLGEALTGLAGLVVDGEPGIGKTALLETALADAETRFPTVLFCRGAEAEAALGFAALSEVLGGIFEDVAEALPPPRRRALEVALLVAEPEDDPPQAHAVGLAVLDVLRELEQRGPVLLAVDDLQWLDSSSAAVLQIALRRLRSERIGVLTTLRDAPDTEAPLQLGGLLPESRLAEIRLGPLGAGALHQLLKSRLDLDLARPDLMRIRDASGGNPLFALELSRELLRSGARLEPGKPLPVPDNLGRLLQARLERLPAETIEVLLVAAAAGDPTIETIVAAYGSREQIRSALEPAKREGLVEVGGRVHFVHPLLASVCYELALAAQRREAHRRLAIAVGDVEERARHLALAAAEPDAEVATALDAAVERGAARGAPATAAELSELAASLTPAGDAAEHRRRRLRAAELHAESGNPERATVLYEQLLDDIPGGGERAAALFGLALLRQAEPSTSVELIDDALREAEGDHALSARILAARASFAVIYDGPDAGVAYYRAALGHAEQAGDPALLASTLAPAGYLETWSLDVTPGLLERGVEIEERLAQPLGYWASPSAVLAHRLVLWEDLGRARRLLEQVAAGAAQRGAEVDRGLALFLLADLEWRAGRWPLALDHIAEALELAGLAHDEYNRPLFEYEQAFFEARLGRIEEARATSERLLTVFEGRSNAVLCIVSAATLGHIELALGNLEAADRHLRDLPARLLALGFREPSLPLWPEAIEALIGVGDLDEALAHLERYEQLAARAGPWARGGAARSRGLLAVAEANLPSAFEAFETSLTELGDLYPFERGLTLLALGAANRRVRQRRSAREALEQALAIFDELGAQPWVEKARAELRRISGRRPASAELTETEERVGQLAAAGRANKEIAAALHMSVHTVEAHLSRAYRKLGIHSRGELAGRLLPAPMSAAKVSETAAKE